MLTLDIDRLRSDMERDSLGAFFGGGYGGAMIEAFDISSASEEELVEIAVRNDIDLSNYSVDSDESTKSDEAQADGSKLLVILES